MRLACLAAVALWMCAAPAMADTAGAVIPGTPASQSDLHGCYTYSVAPSPAAGQQMATPCPGTPGGPPSGGTGASAQQVQGNAAAGATDLGNPVKTGCVYKVTQAVVTDGQRANLACTPRGAPYFVIGRSFDDATWALGTISDGQLTSQVWGLTMAAGGLYNGTTVDLSRSIAQAQSSGSKTGVAAVGGYQAATASVPLSYATATTPQVLVTHSGTKLIYVSAVDMIAAGTTNVTFEYGTGSACDTGTTVLTGAYPLTAQAGLVKGNGGAAFWIVPVNNDLCWFLSAAIQVSGSLSHAQQ